MLDLSHWQRPPQPWLGVFTDIDDTLTTEGAITADALQALTALKQAGLMVVPITGRPMGWSRDFARARSPSTRLAAWSRWLSRWVT